MRKSSAHNELAGVFDPLSEWLPPDEKLNLSQTCTLFYDAFYFDAKREILMESVVWGNQDKAEAMLAPIENDEKQVSALLCTTVTTPIKDPSGKVIKDLTPFQAAFCAGDLEMCEMFRNYFATMDGGLEEMHAQIVALFPEGINTYDELVEYQTQQAEDFKEMLNRLIDVMIAASDDEINTMLDQKQDDSVVDQAFKTFRDFIEEINHKELVFNPYYLLSAYEIYRNRYGNFTSRDERDLFCVQIIGFLQRGPACYLQAFAQGLYGLVERGTPFKRSFKFACYFGYVPVLAVDPISAHLGLGFNYFVGGMNWHGCSSTKELLPGEASRNYFQTFCQTKTAGFQNLCITAPKTSTRCVIL